MNAANPSEKARKPQPQRKAPGLMTDSPRDIAAQALVELGETPGDDPVAQLLQLVATLKQRIEDLGDRMKYEDIAPDPDEWSALRERHLAALLASVRAEQAAGEAAIDELIGEYGTTGDEDER